MRAEVCGTLSAVFPLVVLAVMAQRPSLNAKLRRTLAYRRSVEASVLVGLSGLLLVVVGQQAGGLTGAWAVIGWLLLVIEVLCLGFTVMAAHVTLELEEETPD